ncbi:hypothetical protein CEXT_457061, partial [Caerostris extrusa]
MDAITDIMTVLSVSDSTTLSCSADGVVDGRAKLI